VPYSIQILLRCQSLSAHPPKAPLSDRRASLQGRPDSRIDSLSQPVRVARERGWGEASLREGYEHI